jgi:hypothetical protein
VSKPTPDQRRSYREAAQARYRDHLAAGICTRGSCTNAVGLTTAGKPGRACDAHLAADRARNSRRAKKPRQVAPKPRAMPGGRRARIAAIHAAQLRAHESREVAS